MKFSLTVAAAALGYVSATREMMALIQESHRTQGVLSQGANRQIPSTVVGKPATCTDGTVSINGESFDCDNVDFLSFLSTADLYIDSPAPLAGGTSADIWGWLSPGGKEVTILSLENGVNVIDSTDPVNPCIMAKLPTNRVVAIWADVKVLNNTLYFVKDASAEFENTGDVGIEIYDLLRFDNVYFDCKAEGYVVPNLAPDHIDRTHGSAHNVFVNTETERVYTCGGDYCAGGIHIFDAKNPLEPVYEGCLESDGYTHDAQCVIYTGPDSRYTGRELCFAFNIDALTIWDVTDFATEGEVMVSTTPYFDSAYSHQGWLTRDMTKVLLNDELNELCNSDNPHAYCEGLDPNIRDPGVTNTKTFVFDVSNLTNVVVEGQYLDNQFSIDHNLYVWGAIHEKGWGGNAAMQYFHDPNYAYLHNYVAGLRILDIHSDDVSEWTMAGYFDIYPGENALIFEGAWSGYMHPSGAYAVSSLERGVFFLQPNMAFTEDFPAAAPAVEYTASVAAVVAFIVFVILCIIYVAVTNRNFKKKAAREAAEQATEENDA